MTSRIAGLGLKPSAPKAQLKAAMLEAYPDAAPLTH